MMIVPVKHVVSRFAFDDGGARGNFFHNDSHVLENGRGRHRASLVLVSFSAGVPRHSARPPSAPQPKLLRLVFVFRNAAVLGFHKFLVAAVRRTEGVVNLFLPTLLFLPLLFCLRCLDNRPNPSVRDDIFPW